MDNGYLTTIDLLLLTQILLPPPLKNNQSPDSGMSIGWIDAEKVAFQFAYLAVVENALLLYKTLRQQVILDSRSKVLSKPFQ